MNVQMKAGNTRDLLVVTVLGVLIVIGAVHLVFDVAWLICLM